MRARSRVLWLVSLGLWLASGCTEPRNVGGGANNPPPAPPKDNFIVGKTTQEVRPPTEQPPPGAQVAPAKITAKDPITITGNAYVVAVNSTAFSNVKHAIDLWQAENGRYPKDYQEFKDEILKPDKPDGLRLPRLPFYQEYGYDEKEHKLVIWEYPDKKAGPLPK
jgi:hypothetical protein